MDRSWLTRFWKTALLGIELQAGLRDQDGVVDSAAAHEQAHQFVNRFRAVRTKRKGLAERELSFLQQPLLSAGGFGAQIRRAILAQAPGIKAADGAAQLGEALLGDRHRGRTCGRL